MDHFDKEKKELIKTYEQRKNKDYLYNYLNPQVFLSSQERERYIIKCLKYIKLNQISDLKLFEIGCGSGFNFLMFIRLGFNPSNLYGNDLLVSRIDFAKNILPQRTNLFVGDISDLDFPDNYFDIMYQSVVFSSIININFKKEIADRMWRLTKPGGGILWYDFIFDNPYNKDVKGINFNELKLLFPYGKVKKWKLTLAPPLARIVTKIHPVFYPVFSIFPFLKTHILCWIKKTN